MCNRTVLLVGSLLLLYVSKYDATLSKSDRKPKQKKIKNMETGDEFAWLSDLNDFFSPETVTIDSILSGHARLYTDDRKFVKPCLGYVTPWNNRGYDIAKLSVKKFTHISPVWFQLQPSMIDGGKTCTIKGTHDLDRGWINEIQSGNANITIVPRFLFEGWSVDQTRQFLYEESWQTSCLHVVLHFISRNNFQGAVFEVWLQMFNLTYGRMKQEMIEMLTSWSNGFHHRDLELIIPLTPPLDSRGVPNGLITPKEFSKLMETVDYANVMTYDYQSQGFEGVAPLKWVFSNIAFLLSESSVSATKTLMGLNFYGYELQNDRLRPLIGAEYLDILSDRTAKLKWNIVSKEHLLETKDRKCYYPSLSSISARLQLANHLNVGVAIWDLGQGLDYFTQLL